MGELVYLFPQIDAAGNAPVDPEDLDPADLPENVLRVSKTTARHIVSATLRTLQWACGPSLPPCPFTADQLALVRACLRPFLARGEAQRYDDCVKRIVALVAVEPVRMANLEELYDRYQVGAFAQLRSEVRRQVSAHTGVPIIAFAYEHKMLESTVALLAAIAVRPSQWKRGAITVTPEFPRAPSSARR